MAWLWISRLLPSSGQVVGKGSARAGRSVAGVSSTVQWIRRAFFQAREVWVGPRYLSNSLRVELWMSFALPAARMRVAGVTTWRRASNCCSSRAWYLETLITTSAGAAGSGASASCRVTCAGSSSFSLRLARVARSLI
ncbi:hypothetical protein D3C80_1682830 [compost metagenome]